MSNLELFSYINPQQNINKSMEGTQQGKPALSLSLPHS